MVVASVGDDEQRLAICRAFLHFAQAQVDRIQQRGLAARPHRNQAILQIFELRGKGRDEVRPLAEIDQHELILRIGCLEELQGCFLGLLDFV